MPRLRLLLALLLLAACVTDPVSGRREYSLTSWSPERERAVGAEEGPGLEVELDGILADAEAQEVVRAIVERIVALSPRRDELDFQVTVLASSEPNALALPGGYVYVTRGMLAEIESEAELVSILGHEIGHVEHRHSMTGGSKGALIGLPAIPFEWLGGVLPIGGNVVGFAGGVLRAPSKLVNLKYSREHELQADRRGAYYAHALGYDPRELMRAFDRGYNSERSSILGTHPTDDERRERFERLIREQYPDVLERAPGTFRGTSEAVSSLMQRARREESAYENWEDARALLAAGEEGDLELAWTSLALALHEVQTEPLFWILSGELALERDDVGGAWLSFLRAEALYRDAVGERGHWKPPFYLGVIDLGKERYARASARLLVAAERYPANAALRYYLGLAQEGVGERSAARKSYERALDLESGDPDLRAAIRERLRALGG